MDFASGGKWTDPAQHCDVSRFQSLRQLICWCSFKISPELLHWLSVTVCCSMKFCAYLKHVEGDAPKCFRGKFLDYKKLKKYLKYRARRIELASKGLPAGASLPDLVRSSQQEVASMLQDQLIVIDQYASRPLHSTKRSTDHGWGTLPCCPQLSEQFRLSWQMICFRPQGVSARRIIFYLIFRISHSNLASGAAGLLTRRLAAQLQLLMHFSPQGLVPYLFSEAAQGRVRQRIR